MDAVHTVHMTAFLWLQTTTTTTTSCLSIWILLSVHRDRQLVWWWLVKPKTNVGSSPARGRFYLYRIKHLYFSNTSKDTVFIFTLSNDTGIKKHLYF